MDIVDPDISSNVIEGYEVIENYEIIEDYTDPVNNEDEKTIDPFNSGQVTDGIDMSDSGGSDEITGYYEETVIVDEYSDSVNDVEEENTTDPFGAGMSTDGFIDPTASAEQDLMGNESHALSEIDFWNESADEATEISWETETVASESADYSEGILTEEQIRSLRWFWTKNENQVHQDSEEGTVIEEISYSSGDETVTEDISYLFEEAETVTEDISYSSDAETATEDINYASEEAETVTEEISYSSEVAETVTEDFSYSSEEAEDASELYDGMIEEGMQTDYIVVSEDVSGFEAIAMESVQEDSATTADTAWADTQ